LKSLTGRDQPTARYFFNGTTTRRKACEALKRAAIRDVVLPEATSASPRRRRSIGGGRFTLRGAGGITALSTDGPLSTLFADTSIGAADERRSRWGPWAFLHFEPRTRGPSRRRHHVAPISQTSVAILKDVLNGFASNPFITLATLTPFVRRRPRRPPTRAGRAVHDQPRRPHDVDTLTQTSRP